MVFNNNNNLEKYLILCGEEALTITEKLRYF